MPSQLDASTQIAVPIICCVPDEALRRKRCVVSVHGMSVPEPKINIRGLARSITLPLEPFGTANVID